MLRHLFIEIMFFIDVMARMTEEKGMRGDLYIYLEKQGENY